MRKTLLKRIVFTFLGCFIIHSLAFASNGKAVASLSSTEVNLDQEVVLSVSISGVDLANNNKYRITIPAGLTVRSGQGIGTQDYEDQGFNGTKTIGAYSASCPGEYAFGIADIQSNEDPTWNGNSNNGVLRVKDNIPPTFDLEQAKTVYLRINETVYTVEGSELDPANVNDNVVVSCGGSMEKLTVSNNVNSKNTLSGATFSVGTHTITWAVIDEAGNRVEKQMILRVNCEVLITGLLDDASFCSGESLENYREPVYESNPVCGTLPTGWMIDNNKVEDTRIVTCADEGKEIKFYLEMESGEIFYSQPKTITIKTPTINRIDDISIICAGSLINISEPAVEDKGCSIIKQGWMLGEEEIDIAARIITMDDNGKLLRYFVERNGCENLYSPNSVEIIVAKAPTVEDLAIPDVVCEGDVLTLSVPSVNTYGADVISAEWQLNGNFFDPAQSLSIYDNGAKLTYSVTTACGSGENENEVLIQVEPKPEIDETLPEEIRVCAGSLIEALDVYYEGANLETGWLIGDEEVGAETPISIEHNNKKIKFFAKNRGCIVYSNEADLIVQEPVAITEQLQGGAYYAGDEIQLFVSVSGTNVEKATYAWYKEQEENDILIDNTTSSSLEINPAKESDSGNYYVLISVEDNFCLEEPLKSDVVSIIVSSGIPSISIEEVEPVCAGNTVVLGTPVVDAKDADILDEYWEVYENDAWTSFDESKIFSLEDTGTKIRYIAVNTRGEGISNEVTITVVDKSAIAEIENIITVCKNSEINLENPVINENGTTVENSGWQIKQADEDWKALETSTLMTAALDGAFVRFYAENACGATYSNEAQLSIDEPLIISTLTEVSPICAGNTLTLETPEITAYSSEISAQGWEIQQSGSEDWVSFDAETAVSYLYDASLLRYTATNACGTTITEPVSITVMDKPSISSLAAPSPVCFGNAISMEEPAVEDRNSTVVSTGWEVKPASGTETAWTAFSLDNNTLIYLEEGYLLRYYAENSCGKEFTLPVSLIIKDKPAIATLSVEKTAYYVGDQLEVTIPEIQDNGSSITEQYWMIDGVEYDINEALTIDMNGKALSYYAENECDNTISNAVVITVLEKPAFDADLETPETICENGFVAVQIPSVSNKENVTEEGWLLDGISFNPENDPLSFSDHGKMLKYYVSTAAGTIYSNEVPVSVHEPLEITLQPEAGRICVGSDYSLSIATEGGLDVSYSWYKEGANTVLGTANTLSLENLESSDAGIYYVRINEFCKEEVNSNSISVTIDTPIDIITQPKSVVACVGTDCDFSVEITGSGNVSYNWYKIGAEEVIADTRILELKNVSKESEACFYAIVTAEDAYTCPEKTIVSYKGATLEVEEPVEVAISAINPILCEGSLLELSAQVAEDASTPAYAWYKEGSAAVIGTNSSLAIASVISADSGNYYVAATTGKGTCNAVSSNIIHVSVKEPLTIQEHPVEIEICRLSELELSVSATGSGNLTYAWYKEGDDETIVGTDAQCILENVDLAHAGNYYVKIQTDDNTCGVQEVVSSLAELQVVELPELSVNDITNKKGEINLMDAVTVLSGSYVWFYEDEEMTINISEFVGTHGTKEGKTYYVRAEKDGCSVYSNFKVLREDVKIGVEDQDIYLTVYPNPVSEELTIATNGGNIDNIMLFDEIGRMLKSQTENSNEVKMNVQDMTSGIYYLHINIEGEPIIKKIIKK